MNTSARDVEQSHRGGVRVATLRAYGLSVYLMDQPLDLLVGYAGRTFLAEVKDGPKAPYTAAQAKFLKEWRGQVARLDSVADAEAFAREVRGG